MAPKNPKQPRKGQVYVLQATYVDTDGKVVAVDGRCKCVKVMPGLAWFFQVSGRALGFHPSEVRSLSPAGGGAA